MENSSKPKITIQTTVKAPVDKVWQLWNTPEDVVKWNTATDEWHTPRAENDLREGGKFNYRMEAKDGSFGFDFYGVYDEIKQNERIAYTMGDDRKVDVSFSGNGSETKIVETFEAESENPLEMQQTGWQTILDNFKKYAESK